MPKIKNLVGYDEVFYYFVLDFTKAFFSLMVTCRIH